MLRLRLKNYKFYRYYDEDRYSHRSSLHRSVSHPSLARSDSEFLEQWAAPADESPSNSPVMLRAQRVMVNENEN